MYLYKYVNICRYVYQYDVHTFTYISTFLDSECPSVNPGTLRQCQRLAVDVFDVFDLPSAPTVTAEPATNRRQRRPARPGQFSQGSNRKFHSDGKCVGQHQQRQSAKSHQCNRCTWSNSASSTAKLQQPCRWLWSARRTWQLDPSDMQNSVVIGFNVLNLQDARSI